VADVAGIHQAEEMLNAAEAEVEKTKEAIRPEGAAGRKRSVSILKKFTRQSGVYHGYIIIYIYI